MKIVVVGGGSGGHITPTLAVVRELLHLQPRIEIEFWTDQKNYKNVARQIAQIQQQSGGMNEREKQKAKLRVRRIVAGKFRRYASWKWYDYLRCLPTVVIDLGLKNFGNLCLFIWGFLTVKYRWRKVTERPDAVFLKGGYTGLPVGLVAHQLQIPIILHESDAEMGMANRILSKYAAVIGMGQPFKAEQYPKGMWVGVPIGAEFQPVSKQKQKVLKQALGLSPDELVVVITGGSQGATHLNEVSAQLMPKLLSRSQVVVLTGQGKLAGMYRRLGYDENHLPEGLKLLERTDKMAELLGAADVVISRAGATTIAELAALAKPTILVPFEKLPGGHQVKNAYNLEKYGAVRVIVDKDMIETPEKLWQIVEELLASQETREELSLRITQMVKRGVAEKLASMIIKEGSVCK